MAFRPIFLSIFSMTLSVAFSFLNLLHSLEDIKAVSPADYSSLQETIVSGFPVSQNRLSFTFDATQQLNAIGTYTAYITYPNRNMVFLTGNIGPGSQPVIFQLGPPSLLGSYTITFVIDSLTGTINPNNGPYVIADNLTADYQIHASFSVHNVGDQDTKYFVNRP